MNKYSGIRKSTAIIKDIGYKCLNYGIKDLALNDIRMYIIDLPCIKQSWYGGVRYGVNVIDVYNKNIFNRCLLETSKERFDLAIIKLTATTVLHELRHIYQFNTKYLLPDGEDPKHFYDNLKSDKILNRLFEYNAYEYSHDAFRKIIESDVLKI